MARLRKRPKSVLLVSMGIVAILAGSLGLLCGCCGAVDSASLFVGTPESREIRAYLDTQAPAWVVLVTVRAIGVLLLSLLALVAGIGLVMRQSWARWMAVLFSIFSIPLHLIFAIYGLGAYMPAMERYFAMKSGAGPGFSTGFRAGFMATFLPPVVICLAASVTLILGLMNSHASAALAPVNDEPRHRDDFDDDDDL